MKPESCTGCPLYNAAGPVWGSGSYDAQLLILGQNPGPTEIEEGRPFCGSSGRILDRGLGVVGISRNNNYISNVVKCFVAPGTPVPEGAVNHCKPLLEKELSRLPHVNTILTLGGEAFDSICYPKKFHTIHDRKVSRKSPNYWLRGCPFPLSRGGKKYVVIPTFHPSFVARTGFTISPIFEKDLEKTFRFTSGESFLVTPSYNYSPSTGEIRDYIDEIITSGSGGLDIETPESSIEEDELVEGGYLPVGLIGISARRNHALGVSPGQFDLLKPLFNMDDRSTSLGVSTPILWAFNAGFDFHHLRRLYALNGIKPADAMMGLHLLYPDLLRKDLGTCMSLFTDLPFHKNLVDSDPELYNAGDTYGVLEAGENIIKEFQKLESKQHLFDWVQQSIEKLFWNHLMPIIPIVGDWNVRGANYDQNTSDLLELQCALTLKKYTDWWDTNIPLFSWSSPKQLVTLFTQLGLKVPNKKRPNGKSTPCMDDSVLENFSKSGNKTAALIQQMRLMKKATDFFNLADEQGRVKCRGKIHGQVGGRIQTVNRNMQQVPEEIASVNPRVCIIPELPSEDLIISADFSQIEFWIYAWYSQCKRALDIKESGEYLYGAFYEDIWREPFFKPNTKRTKSDRDASCTPAWKLLIAKSWPLGFIYGRSAPDPKLQGLPIGRDKAKSIHHNFHRDYPEVGTFHSRIKFLAHKTGYLQTVFGRIRRFPNPDGQHNELLAFPGQSTACDVLIRNALLPLSEGLPRLFGERSHIYFTVHDSVICSVNCAIDHKLSLSKAIDAYDYVKQCMETPIPEMNGFIIPAEVKIGPSWGDGVGKEKLSGLLFPSTV